MFATSSARFWACASCELLMFAAGFSVVCRLGKRFDFWHKNLRSMKCIEARSRRAEAL